MNTNNLINGRHATRLAAMAILMLAAGCDLSGIGGGGNTNGGTRPTVGPGTPTPTASPTPTPDDTVPTPTPTPTPGVPDISCASHSDCDNGVFCDGVEQCVNVHCAAGDDPCPSPFEQCDEQAQDCVPIDLGCNSDADCDANERCAVDTGTCHPIVAINCGPGAGACNIDNFTPGCEIQACCDDVCLFDQSCCSFQWTADCAALALSISDCLRP